MRILKQSTARNLVVFMTDAADHISGKTGLTLTITASKDGAAFASISPTVTERGSGWYNLELTTAHTDTLGDLAIHITGAAADPTDLVAQVCVGLPGESAADITAIRAKTDNLPSDPADASVISGRFDTVDGSLSTLSAFVDTEVAAIKAKTDNLPTDPADASDIAAAFGTVNSTLSTIAGYIDTEVAAIKAKTDNLPTDPADASDIAAAFSTVNSTLSTIGGYLDTEVAAIKAKTDNLPSDPADASVIAGRFDTVDSSLSTLSSDLSAGITALKGVKKGDALAEYQFPMFNSSGDPTTGLTVTVQISKDGGSFNTVADTVEEITNGFYKIDFSGTEMNAKTIAVRATASGAKATTFTIVTEG